jgi:hypothetical protein
LKNYTATLARMIYDGSAIDDVNNIINEKKKRKKSLPFIEDLKQ